MENKKRHDDCNKENDMEPYGQAYINGYRIVFNPYVFKKGKNKDKVQCFYRKGKGYKKIILKESDIKPFERDK